MFVTDISHSIYAKLWDFVNDEVIACPDSFDYLDTKYVCEFGYSPEIGLLLPVEIKGTMERENR